MYFGSNLEKIKNIEAQQNLQYSYEKLCIVVYIKTMALENFMRRNN